MRWVIIKNTDEAVIYGRIDHDGLMRITCVEEHSELQEWISNGNTPEQWTGE